MLLDITKMTGRTDERSLFGIEHKAAVTMKNGTVLSNLIFLAIFLIGHSLMPDSSPNSNDKMSHYTPIICSVHQFGFECV